MVQVHDRPPEKSYFMDPNEFNIKQQIQKSGIVVNGKKYHSLQEIPLDQIPAPLRRFLIDSDGNGVMDFVEKGLLGKLIGSQLKNTSNKEAMEFLQKVNTNQNLSNEKTDDFYRGTNSSEYSSSRLNNASNYKSIEVEGAGRIPTLIFLSLLIMGFGIAIVYFISEFEALI